MKLQDAYEAYDQGKIDWSELQAEQDAAAEDSIRRLEEVGEADRDPTASSASRASRVPDQPTRWRAPGLAENLAVTGSSSRSSTTATTASCRG